MNNLKAYIEMFGWQKIVLPSCLRQFCTIDLEQLIAVVIIPRVIGRNLLNCCCNCCDNAIHAIKIMAFCECV